MSAYQVWAVRASGLGGHIALHDYGTHIALHWGVAGAYETDSREEADSMAERATAELGEWCVRSDLWFAAREARGLAEQVVSHSPNFGGVLT